jgi:ABC-type transport system involved in multi-copper enzyme maturation permease subunit
MITLARIELRKLTTTPALYVSAGIVALFTVVSVAAGIMLAGQQGTPPLGSEPNVTKTLSIAALSSMVMLVLGILATAGEFRQRTIMWTFLAEPRRGRVLAAKLAVLGAVGAAMGALAFGLALAIAVPWYAARGIHVLPVSVPALWAGATVAGACYGLLGVALGALTRNTIAAVLGGLAWVQIVEVGLLQHFVPALAKWLPTGAAVAITTPARRTSCCHPGWLHSCSPDGRWRWRWSPPG